MPPQRRSLDEIYGTGRGTSRGPASTRPSLDELYPTSPDDTYDDRDVPWYKQAWGFATRPLTNVFNQAAQGISEAITTHHIGESKLGSQLKGFAGGAIEGAGDLISGFTSPLGIVTSVVGGPAIRGVRNIVRGARALAGTEEALPALTRLPGGAAREFSTLTPAPKLLPVTPLEYAEPTVRGPLTYAEQVAGIEPGRLMPRTPAGRLPGTLEEVLFPKGRAGISPGRPTASAGIVTPGAERLTAGPMQSLDELVGRRPHFEDLGATAEDLPLSGTSRQLDLPVTATAVRPPKAPRSAADMERALTGEGDVGPAIPPETAISRFSRFLRGEPEARGGGLLPEDAPRGSYLDETGQVIEPTTTAPTPAMTPAVHPEIEKLWKALVPKWKKTVEAQAGDEIPFTVDPYEDLPSFARRVREDDPRSLFSAERHVRKLIDEGGGGESGFVDPAAFTPEHVGAVASTGAKGLEKLRYFSMLSSPTTHLKNVLGNVGGIASHDLELALNRGLQKLTGGRLGQITGDEGTYALPKLFTKKTLSDVVSEYRNPTSTTDKWGQTEGVLGIPGRAMGAVDAATQDVLARAGVVPKLRQEITYRDTPHSGAGAGLYEYTANRPSVKLVAPFVKTSVNLLERGIERTPGLGTLAQLLTKGQMQTSLAKQLVGAGAGAAGLAAGEAGGKRALADRRSGLMNNRYLQAALGPAALPFILASEYAARGQKGGTRATEYEKLKAAWTALLRTTPAPLETTTYDPEQWLSQLVPNALQPMNELLGTPSRSFQTRGSFTAPALAKIPFLNKLLLKRKPRPIGR